MRRTWIKWLASVSLALVASGAVIPVASAQSAQPQSPAIAAQNAPAGRDCIAKNNMDEVVAKFISRCKQGKIRQKITSDRLSRTLGEIYSGKLKGNGDDVTAWKVLNDHRFDKPRSQADVVLG